MSSFFSGWVCLGSVAALTLAISCFTQLRNLYKQLMSRIVVNLTISGHQADAMLLYAREHFKHRVSVRERMWDGSCITGRIDVCN